MRFKWLKRFLSPDSRLLAAVFAILPGLHSGSAAATAISPVVPEIAIDSTAGERTVYYLDSSYAGVISPDFRVRDFNSGALIEFTVSGLDTTQQYLWVFAETTGGAGSYSSIPLAGCNGAPVAVNTGCFYGTNPTISVFVNLRNICSTVASIRGCTGGAVDLASNPIPGFRLRFATNTSPTTQPDATTRADAPLIAAIPQKIAPTITACPSDPGFFPSDEAIIVDTNLISAQADVLTTGSSPVFPTVWMVAQQGGAIPVSPFTATLYRGANYHSGEATLNGFENSTAEAQVFYEMNVGVQDSAGAVTFCPGPTGPGHGPFSNVFSTDIQGFLRESNCFIATASFRSGHAPAVMLLREFRDGILSRSELGRTFIAWYYANGPKAADWLIEHPVYRLIVLTALLPLQALAWVALHPLVLWIPFAALLLLVGILFRRSLPLLLIAGIASTAAATSARAADQPYIDSLISELPPNDYKPTSDVPDPYIQQQKRGVAPEEPTEGYTEHIRKGLDPREGSEGYSKRIQDTLPKSEGSAIEDYRAGRKLKANKGSPIADSAFGFKLAATTNRTYSAGENQDVAYEEVYGNGWVPDFTLHYESRVFSPNSFLHKLGLYGSIGSSFTKAQGVFDYLDTRFPDARAKTDFQFVMIPVNLGLIYRMNFGILFPYFGGGPSVIGVLERRNDEQPGNRGYNFGYWFTGGVAFGLDFLSRETSWDRYETAGIKHTYLTIDYSYLSSLSGGLIDMTVDGLALGFTFEL